MPSNHMSSIRNRAQARIVQIINNYLCRLPDKPFVPVGPCNKKKQHAVLSKQPLLSF